MGLYRMRVELEDRPGRLAEAAGALAGLGANLVGLDVHLLGDDRVADELVVELAIPIDLPALAAAVAGIGDPVAVREADVHDLVDPPAAALELARQVLDHEHPVDEAAGAAARLVGAERHWMGPVGGFELIGLAARAAVEGVPVMGTEPVKSLPPAGPTGPHRSIGPWVLAVPATIGGDARVVVLARRSPRFSFTETARVQALLRLFESARAPRSDEIVVLADGGRVEIRSLHPSDRTALVRMHARCSDLSRYRRYFTGMAELRPDVLEPLVAVDGIRCVAMVALLGSEVVGVVHCHRQADDRAEMAVLIEDGHQRRGIGSALLRRIASVAGGMGIEELVAVSLADNQAIGRLIRAAGFAPVSTLDGGLRRFTFPTAVPSPR